MSRLKMQIHSYTLALFSFSSWAAFSSLEELTKGLHPKSESAAWAVRHLQIVWGWNKSSPCKIKRFSYICTDKWKHSNLLHGAKMVLNFFLQFWHNCGCPPKKSKQKNSSDHRPLSTMYLNPSGAENGSYSLTFLGRKVGRHHSVAPAGKQRECKTH